VTAKPEVLITITERQLKELAAELERARGAVLLSAATLEARSASAKPKAGVMSRSAAELRKASGRMANVSCDLTEMLNPVR
jgi:hypothetical protein